MLSQLYEWSKKVLVLKRVKEELKKNLNKNLKSNTVESLTDNVENLVYHEKVGYRCRRLTFRLI